MEQKPPLVILATPAELYRPFETAEQTLPSILEPLANAKQLVAITYNFIDRFTKKYVFAQMRVDTRARVIGNAPWLAFFKVGNIDYMFNINPDDEASTMAREMHGGIENYPVFIFYDAGIDDAQTQEKIRQQTELFFKIFRIYQRCKKLQITEKPINQIIEEQNDLLSTLRKKASKFIPSDQISKQVDILRTDFILIQNGYKPISALHKTVRHVASMIEKDPFKIILQLSSESTKDYLGTIKSISDKNAMSAEMYFTRWLEIQTILFYINSGVLRNYTCKQPKVLKKIDTNHWQYKSAAILITQKIPT